MNEIPHDTRINTDGTATDVASMVALMDTQRRSTHSRLVRRYTILLLVWAAAWAIGFGSLWFGRDIGTVGVIPTMVAWIIFGVCIGAAVAWSIVTNLRGPGDGVRGRSQLQSTLYGWSWTIGMVGAWFLVASMQRAGLSTELAALLYPGIFALMTGALYLSGGAVWRSPVQYILGIVMIVVAVVATFIGAPIHFLIYATAGPVAMVVVAVLLLRGVVPHEPRHAESAGVTL